MLNPLPTVSIPPPLLFNIKSRTNDGDWTETNKCEIVNGTNSTDAIFY